MPEAEYSVKKKPEEPKSWEAECARKQEPPKSWEMLVDIEEQEQKQKKETYGERQNYLMSLVHL